MIENLDVVVAPDAAPVRCALALPASMERSPALIVVHEWWGLNDDMRAMCERFADAGFVALAVDLYGGRTTTDASVAMQLSIDMKTTDAVRIVAAAVESLRAHPRTNGKVGVTGFCLGGAVSIAAACNVARLHAAVPFYGTPRDELADFTNVKVPILGHYGRRDPIVSVERVELLARRAAEAGARFDVCWYDAGHAFMRASDASAYDAPSAALAWDRTLAFLRDALA